MKAKRLPHELDGQPRAPIPAFPKPPPPLPVEEARAKLRAANEALATAIAQGAATDVRAPLAQAVWDSDDGVKRAREQAEIDGRAALLARDAERVTQWQADMADPEAAVRRHMSVLESKRPDQTEVNQQLEKLQAREGVLSTELAELNAKKLVLNTTRDQSTGEKRRTAVAGLRVINDQIDDVLSQQSELKAQIRLQVDKLAVANADIRAIEADCRWWAAKSISKRVEAKIDAFLATIAVDCGEVDRLVAASLSLVRRERLPVLGMKNLGRELEKRANARR